MILERPLNFVRAQVLNVPSRIQKVLLGILITGLGISLGYLLSSPGTAELTVAILASFALALVIAHRPLNGVVLWLILAPFVETRVKIHLGAGIPDLSFSRFTIAFLAVFMLARAAIGRFRFARIGLADVCIVATSIGIMTSAPLAENPRGGVQTAIALYFTPLVVYFFSRNLVRNKEDLHKILMAVAILGFVSGAYAAYEHATGNILFSSREADMLFRGHSGIRIIRGIYGGSGTMGRVLAATIPVTAHLFLERRRTWIERSILAGMLATEGYGILITMSRTPWYALLIALFIIQFFHPQFRRVFFAITLAAAVVVWATWAQVSESDVANRVNDPVSTLEGREARWQAGYNMWQVKPIRGWGFGRYEEESGRFRTDGERTNFRAIENDYLHILVGSGLIGFLPYLLLLLAPLVNSLRLFFRTRAPDWSGFIKPETIAVYWAVIICLLITSYTAIHVEPTIRLVAFAVAGAVVGSHEPLLHRSKAFTEDAGFRANAEG